MAINFPSSPAVNDLYVYNGITYKWDGTFWTAQLGIIPVVNGGTGQATEAEALGEMIQPLTADTAPDFAADYVVTYDASVDTGKKVVLNDASPFPQIAESNIILNGCNAINQDQGDTYFGINWIGGTWYYTDGWKLYSTVATPGSSVLNVGTVNPTTIGSPPFGGAFQTCHAFQITTAGQPSPAATDETVNYQYIEYNRVKMLGGGRAGASPCTVSFWIYASITGTMCVSFASAGTSSRIYVQEVVIAAANTWQYVTLTFPGDTSSPTAWEVAGNATGAYLFFTLVAGSSKRGQTAGSWQAWTSSATAAQSNFLATAGNAVYITGIFMLPGNRAPTAAVSPLLQRSHGSEKTLAQRYFQKFTFGVRWVCQSAGFPMGWPATWPPMRVTPTVTLTAAARVNVSTAAFTTLDISSAIYVQTGSGAVVDVSANDGVKLDARL